jgi:hypothetical protein
MVIASIEIVSFCICYLEYRKKKAGLTHPGTEPVSVIRPRGDRLGEFCEYAYVQISQTKQLVEDGVDCPEEGR